MPSCPDASAKIENTHFWRRPRQRTSHQNRVALLPVSFLSFPLSLSLTTDYCRTNQPCRSSWTPLSTCRSRSRLSARPKPRPRTCSLRLQPRPMPSSSRSFRTRSNSDAWTSSSPPKYVWFFTYICDMRCLGCLLWFVVDGLVHVDVDAPLERLRMLKYINMHRC